jgi:hypothetical protein
MAANRRAPALGAGGRVSARITTPVNNPPHDDRPHPRPFPNQGRHRPEFDAEACLWARAYFPLSRWVEFALVTPTVFVLMMLLLVINGRKR